MSGWVCQTCLVPNDDCDLVCCCCSTAKPTLDEKGQGGTDAIKDSVREESSENDDNQQRIKRRKAAKRVTLRYRQKDLKDVSLFLVGSGEIDQIPLSICDREKNAKEAELSPLYECVFPTPILEGIDGTISSVSCGALHTAVLTKEGKVYTFGCNDMGALGRSAEDSEEKGILDCNPCIVSLREVVTKVTCGDNHTLFLTVNGAVYFSGSFRDSSGSIGVPDFQSKKKLINAEHFRTPMILPLSHEGAIQIKDICSGGNHCIALPSSGSGVYVFGSNEFGQLMLPRDHKPMVENKNVDMSDENNYKLALTWPQFLSVTDLGIGRVAPAASNKRKRPNEEYINRIFTGSCTAFIEVGPETRIYGAGRNAHGEVGCGSDELMVKQPTEVVGLRDLNIVKIMGGQYFTVALTSSRELYTWGNNCYTGHGGDDDFSKLTSPAKLDISNKKLDNVFIGADAVFVVTADGYLYAWGSEQNYILGNGKDGVFQKLPKKVPRINIKGMKVRDGMGGTQHTVFLCQKVK